MSSDSLKAEIVRSGTAIELENAEGQRTRLCYHEIVRRLGAKIWTADQELPCIHNAQLDGTRLELNFGDQERVLDLAANEGDNDGLRVLSGGRVMTSSTAGLKILDKASIVLEAGRVAWVGLDTELSACDLDLRSATALDLQGRLVTPGLVDCHAHPLFAGQRANEFARRARGDHYLDIAKEGGGIQATVVPTRNASIAEHVALCASRMQHAIQWGTTTMESKSGYDLRVSGELRLLRVAAMVDALQSVDLMPTLLGAHALPKEFAEDRNGFLDAVVEQMIPQCAAEGLAEAVDVYCDEGAFSLAETRRILEAAQDAGLALKAHIGQFADLGGAQLLAELGARSGDHLEEVSAEGIAAMAKAKVVATMLPGACVQLKMTPPKVKEFREAGLTMALASDLNPGTSHSENLALAMWLATTHYEMSVDEAWLGVTRHAAQALGRSDIGDIAVGKQADLVIWDAESHAEIPYHFGINLVHQVIKHGTLL